MGLLKYGSLTERYRVWRYNRRRRPWRSVSFIHAALGRKNCAFRICLCCTVFMELAVLAVKEPAVFTEAGRLFVVEWENSQTSETANTGMNNDPRENNDEGEYNNTEDHNNTGLLQGTYPPDKRDSGVTIDLKEGKVEFWRTEQTVRPPAEEKADTGK